MSIIQKVKYQNFNSCTGGQKSNAFKFLREKYFQLRILYLVQLSIMYESEIMFQTFTIQKLLKDVLTQNEKVTQEREFHGRKKKIQHRREHYGILKLIVIRNPRVIAVQQSSQSRLQQVERERVAARISSPQKFILLEPISGNLHFQWRVSK